MATLREVLQDWDNEPVLLDDGSTRWRPDMLRDALEEYEREAEDRRQPDEPAETHPLDEEVYSCAQYITRLNEQGYHITPWSYTVLHIGEEPYRVQREPKGYRVICVEDKERKIWRYIHGQNSYEQKQSAYRRKSHLNTDWQKLRLLGA